MDIVFSDHLFKIQKGVAYTVIIMILIALGGNFIFIGFEMKYLFEVSFNLFLILCFFITLFKDSNAFRLMQIILMLLTGLMQYLINDEPHYLGDLLIITGVLFFYIYRFIPKFNSKALIPIIVGIILFRFIIYVFSKNTIIYEHILSSSFSLIVIIFFISIFQNQLSWYTIRSYHNEKMNRVGMNAANLIHEQNLDHIAVQLKDIKLLLERKQLGLAGDLLQITANMVEKHNRLRRVFLDSHDADKGMLEATFNLNKELQAMTHFEYLNHDQEGGFYLEPVKEFCKEALIIHGNRYEITGIFQNIINNAVEAMQKNKDIVSHKLCITTRKENDNAIVTISDTGKGFPGADKQGQVKIGNIKTSKDGGGFGFVLIKYFVQLYKGSIEVFNKQDGGATVRIVLPLLKENQV